MMKKLLPLLLLLSCHSAVKRKVIFNKGFSLGTMVREQTFPIHKVKVTIYSNLEVVAYQDAGDSVLHIKDKDELIRILYRAAIEDHPIDLSDTLELLDLPDTITNKSERL